MDNSQKNVLIELGTEELPPKSLKQLSESFAVNIAAEFNKLGFECSEYETFGAPRRLGIKLNNIQRRLADSVVEKRGPAVSVAFDENGQATKAALGWARGNGISIDQAERLITDKGEWLLHKAVVAGKNLDTEIEGIINRAIKKLPIPKPMRWGSSDVEFIRPAHTLTVLYGDEVLPASVLGLVSSNQISGHRFHGEHRATVKSADEYKEALRQQYVLVDYASRAEAIKNQLNETAEKLGLIADFDQSLLEEISSLVEWPVVLQAEFEKEFLEVPKEALIYTMKDDQKYVPLLNKDGSLSNQFLFVSNIESNDPQQIISGNEKVIRPRLSDARFFFETDKKSSLRDKTQKLKEITFQKQLGTIADKSKRVEILVGIIGKAIDASVEDIALAQRAAMLAKADLVSNMVMEFPSVQGIMGRHYAEYDGEDSLVAQAIEEQYLPRFANDALPQSKPGVLVSLAEKLDTLVGIFGVNLLPKGDKDPFALRRAAIGVLRIMLDQDIDTPLATLINQVTLVFGDKLSNHSAGQQVTDFLLDRCKPYYAEQGISADIINAVLRSQGELSLADFNRRIEAIAEFAASPAGKDLIAANKRVSNILNKNNIQMMGQQQINQQLLQDENELSLFSAFQDIQSQFTSEQQDYKNTLADLSNLRAPLAGFFDNVMIMVDDESIKQNRIKLVSNVRNAFMSIADISLINV